MNNDVLILLGCFPYSKINSNGEFIAHSNIGNAYFSVVGVKESDIKEKVIEWFSRDAYKTVCFRNVGIGRQKNNEYHKYISDGINEYLGTDFKENDFEVIYTRLGNSVNHDLTKTFIESGYDLSVLY